MPKRYYSTVFGVSGLKFRSYVFYNPLLAFIRVVLNYVSFVNFLTILIMQAGVLFKHNTFWWHGCCVCRLASTSPISVLINPLKRTIRTCIPLVSFFVPRSKLNLSHII